MGKTSNESKQKWVNEKRKQIKAVVTPSVADAFKAACFASGQSVNKTLADFMEGFAYKNKPKTAPRLHFSTRSQRRKSLQAIMALLNELRDAECNYFDSIPENLRSGDRYDNSASCIEALDEAISLLEEVF